MNLLVISQMFPCRRHPTSAIFFANLMKELAKRVRSLTVVTPRAYIPKGLTKLNKRWSRWRLDPMVSTEKGIRIIRPYVFTIPGPAFTGLNSLFMNVGLKRLLEDVTVKPDIDLILGYNMLPEGCSTVHLAKKFDLPSAFWAIGSDVHDFAQRNWLNYHLSRKCIEQADLILTESQELEFEVKKFSNRIKQIKTFYKGIDLSYFRDHPPKPVILQILNLKPGRRYLLFVGRLIRDKGIHELVQSFKNLAQRYADLDLILVGEEDEKSKLRAELEQAGLLQRVVFTGIISQQDVARYMNVAEMLVFPSWAEGLPNAVMEAMAAGLPVVASDVGGIPEIVVNGVSGLLVSPRNVAALTKAVDLMLQNEDLRASCRRNAECLIRKKFDVRRNVDELCALLQMLQNSKRCLAWKREFALSIK
ncbi:glycosyltransferase family 4 protein [candidate division KSB1 bacterium]|nr:glycosyltransferase family 4 protein [candidate division KSB1 bacterium]NIR71066.1 glycosyltransferase family 4 protein [candidate division KSB1 bacterium]NIS24770.1 glycosyltransferase family 4 protein [candidate division KSB1 bacterium]NIT71675.1 glycosyltransferase family 4 protein [candidate division KSB1 bacterium]NIU25382.1 glycosyltransferase family 4 protein [candidate division KSB1 bacterium]